MDVKDTPQDIEPQFEREINGGIQKIYRFPNGYGASIVKHQYSYGGNKGLWELGVLHGGEGFDITLCYRTDVTQDVIGWLTPRKVQNNLREIQNLPANDTCTHAREWAVTENEE